MSGGARGQTRVQRHAPVLTGVHKGEDTPVSTGVQL